MWHLTERQKTADFYKALEQKNAQK